jgi:hypothetical protein
MAAAMDKWWDDCVSQDSVRMRNKDGSKKDTYLLWGDRVRVLENDAATEHSKVFGRGATGWVPDDALGGEPVLELDIIDVGQGDGLLVVTPEGHHIMIDGGDLRSRQQTGKNAADFVDWKFFNDYRFFNERTTMVDCMIWLRRNLVVRKMTLTVRGLRWNDFIIRDCARRNRGRTHLAPNRMSILSVCSKIGLLR